MSLFVISAPSSGEDDGGGDLLVSAMFNFNTSTSPAERNKDNQTHRYKHTADKLIHTKYVQTEARE